MRKVISLIILSVLLSLHIFAQTKNNKTEEKLNLDGTWVLEKFEGSSYLSIKDFENYLLIISSAKNELKIKKSYVFRGEPAEIEVTLFTHNRGERNVVPWSAKKNIEESSKTRIKKNKAIREHSSKTEINGKEQAFRGIDRYYLSKDGNKLIFEQTQTFPSILIPGQTNGSKFIFRRQS